MFLFTMCVEKNMNLFKIILPTWKHLIAVPRYPQIQSATPARRSIMAMEKRHCESSLSEGRHDARCERQHVRVEREG